MQPVYVTRSAKRDLYSPFDCIYMLTYKLTCECGASLQFGLFTICECNYTVIALADQKL